jgi:D-hexose-6-phosphate mutarotase
MIATNILTHMVHFTLNHLTEEECDRLAKCCGGYNSPFFIKEFCHICLKLPSQSGHTTAAVKVLPNYFKMEDIVYIVPNSIMKQHINHMVNANTYKDMPNSFTIQEFKRNMEEREFKCIVFDAYFYQRLDEDEMIHLASTIFPNEPGNLLVFLG